MFVVSSALKSRFSPFLPYHFSLFKDRKRRGVQRNRQKPEEQRNSDLPLFLWPFSVPLYPCPLFFRAFLSHLGCLCARNTLWVVRDLSTEALQREFYLDASAVV
jgi:hypothetical protein